MYYNTIINFFMASILSSFLLTFFLYSVVAQLVERLAVNEDVTGSSPVHGAVPTKKHPFGCFFVGTAPSEQVLRTCVQASKRFPHIFEKLCFEKMGNLY